MGDFDFTHFKTNFAKRFRTELREILERLEGREVTDDLDHLSRLEGFASEFIPARAGLAAAEAKKKKPSSNELALELCIPT